MSRRTIRLCGQEVDQPGHICAFFTSRDEEYDTLIPYFKDGLDADEDVLNVLDASRLQDHRARLAAGGLTADHAHLTIATSEETYLAGGRFDMGRMMAFVTNQLADASAKGRCVRTAGWMEWVHRELPGTERVIEYEARMNILVPTFDCTFMCVYDLTKLSGAMMVDVMATHPYVILKGQVRQNPFFVPPEVYLKELFASQKPTYGPSRPEPSRRV